MLFWIPVVTLASAPADSLHNSFSLLSDVDVCAVLVRRWYHNVVGGGNCAIVDTYWQTETGGHIITPLPGSCLNG